MSALKKQNLSNYHLDNPSWTKESLLNGMVVLHTIKCEKVSQQIVQKLQQNEFSLQNSKKSRELYISNKNTLTTTEMQEVHVDKLKITEGSIVSLVKPNGKSKVISINEDEPLSFKDLTSQPAVETHTESSFQAIEHERLVFKHEVARDKNSFFFRAKDSENLYVLGDNFYKDFKNGFKHFSFAHIEASESQKKSILGIASFIYYFENLKILILTSSMDKTFYSSFKNDETKMKSSVTAYPEFEYELFHHEGLNFLEIDEISQNSKKHKVKGVEYLVKKIVDDYDLVFYDLPSIPEARESYDIYFPILQLIENVTFIVNLKKNTYSEMDKLRNFFLNYKINLKGFVVDKECRDEDSK